MDVASALFRGRALAPEVDARCAEQVVQLQTAILTVLSCSPRFAEAIVERIPQTCFLSGFWETFFVSSRFDHYCFGLEFYHRQKLAIGLGSQDELAAVVAAIEVFRGWAERGLAPREAGFEALRMIQEGQILSLWPDSFD